MALDPGHRQVEVRAKLPAYALQRVEAEARIGALYHIVVFRRLYRVAPGRARRRQVLRALAELGVQGSRTAVLESAVRGAVDAGRVNRGLAEMVGRAHRWRRVLESGRFGSTRELAMAVGVDSSYVARLLRFTLLAPDIAEAILEAREPGGLSMERLCGMPAGWEEQRRVLGVG